MQVGVEVGIAIAAGAKAEPEQLRPGNLESVRSWRWQWAHGREREDRERERDGEWLSSAVLTVALPDCL